jgi:molecular chaperone HtpG
MPSHQETLEFKSELRQVLNIITHSLYSHKEVFLRELISNASDAIDTVRFNSISNEDMLEGNRDWKIKLIPDKRAGTLTIADNGIGMSRETVIENLGTIARSGTKAFIESLKAAGSAAQPELIGQFGVGFYSAFMVADRVTVLSRMTGDPTAGVRWESDGTGSFTVETVPKATRGTEITLHLKEEEKDFLEDWTLRRLVKQFSDFIEHPIVMDADKENEKKEKETVEETLNSRKALWLRSKSDVTTEEYNAFYQQVSGDYTDPAKVIHYAGEGTMEFKVLLFIPSHKPFDMQFGEQKYGPKLYIRRVLIMDHCEQLLPPYLRFVRGVVDSSDLPLNVSRELLQQNPLLEKIQRNLVKSVLKALEEMKTSSPEDYQKFFTELGGVVKEGIATDHANREQVADLMLYESISTAQGKTTTLPQYVDAMPADQKDIYYLTGESRALIEHAPTLEVFRSRSWDVLLMTDPIDEFVLPSLHEYRGKQLKAADKGEIEGGDAIGEEEQKKFAPLFTAMKDKLQGIREVRLSRRLKESASCLVSDESALGANMERLMQKLGQGGRTAERILELNGGHPIVQSLLALHTARATDERIEPVMQLLYEQAVIAEGSKLVDPQGFARRVNDLIARNLAAGTQTGNA